MKRKILKCDCIRYSQSEISTVITANSQLYTNIPRGDFVNSLLNNYLHINFDALHAASNDRYADNNDKRLGNLGPIALFSNYVLTASSGKHLEDISHAHIVSLLYKLITSAKGLDDLSGGFDRDRNRRQQELTNNKIQKGNFHVGIMLKDIFGFSEHQERHSYRLGYKLNLTRGSDNSVLDEDNAVNIGNIRIMLLNGMYHIIPHQFPNKLIYLNRFQVRYQQSFNT